MTYVLVIVSFVAMGGPKPNTVTIDHIDGFQNFASCDATRQWITSNTRPTKMALACQPKS